MKILMNLVCDENPSNVAESDTDVNKECTEDSEIKKENPIEIFIVSVLVFSLIFSFAAAISSSFRQPIPVQHEDLPKM